jgi:hypothetical protein
MQFSHPILRWLLSLRDNMIWKILGLIWFGLDYLAGVETGRVLEE